MSVDVQRQVVHVILSIDTGHSMGYECTLGDSVFPLHCCSTTPLALWCAGALTQEQAFHRTCPALSGTPLLCLNAAEQRQRSRVVQETYANPDRLWESVEDDKENSWYRPAVEYWDRQEASYNGVLGGYGYVSDADITESTAFLRKAFASQLKEGSQGTRHLVAAGVTRMS